MSQGRLAVDVVGSLELSEAARILLTPGIPAETYFDALVTAELYPEAIRFMARLLTKPQAVWWGCLCVWHLVRPAEDSPAAAAIRAAVTWLREPTDAHRRLAGQRAQDAGPTEPAGLLAYAAFLTDGSMSPPGLPEVKPPADAAAICVANAVLGASRYGPPRSTPHRQRTSLGLAVDVYHGTNTWRDRTIP